MSSDSHTRGTTKNRLVSGSFWVVAETVGLQGLRLVSNLALTRILAPEAFGLMAILVSVVQMLTLFTEMGVQGSIIHNERGDEPHFLDVAFTMQAVRGVAVTVVVSLLSYPAALFYDEPRLAVLLPVLSLSSTITGLCSTSLQTLVRHLQPVKAAITQVGAKVATVVLTIVLALIWRSVWALVVGNLVNVLLVAIVSHFLIPGYRNRFAFDKEVSREIIGFGRWVWVATMATWLVGQGDKLILGKFLTPKELGIYAIAGLLPSAGLGIVGKLGRRILQPFYASVLRDAPNTLRQQTFRVRLSVTVAMLPIAWLFILFGDQIVALFYDERYAEAGWMTSILAAAAVPEQVQRSAERVLLAGGDSFEHMVLSVSTGVLFLLGFGVGAWVGGMQAILAGILISRYVAYVPLAIALRKKGVWLPKLDLSVFFLTAVVGAVAVAIR